MNTLMGAKSVPVFGYFIVFSGEVVVLFVRLTFLNEMAGCNVNLAPRTARCCVFEGASMKTDSELKRDVLAELSWDPLVPESRVGVAVDSAPQGRVRVVVEKGWVTLSGELDWNFQRRSVERLIRPLKGVIGITDDIRLKAMAVPSNLSSRITDALTRQATREAKRIEIEVDGSVVTLRGHVHSWAERTAAEGVTWSAPGVSRVNNQLVVDA